MIAFLDGTVKTVRKNFIILMTDHVGYKVFVTPQILAHVQPGQKITFYTHTYIREDIMALYGFPTIAELEFYELLLSVSGIGPKMALAIMSIGDLDAIRTGIAGRDVEIFTQVPGVGRKTAERLILDLREKIEHTEAFGQSRGESDVIAVLMALGYSRTEARDALSAVPVEITNSEEKVRQALRSLAKQ